MGSVRSSSSAIKPYFWRTRRLMTGSSLSSPSDRPSHRGFHRGPSCRPGPGLGARRPRLKLAWNVFQSSTGLANGDPPSSLSPVKRSVYINSASRSSGSAQRLAQQCPNSPYAHPPRAFSVSRLARSATTQPLLNLHRHVRAHLHLYLTASEASPRRRTFRTRIIKSRFLDRI